MIGRRCAAVALAAAFLAGCAQPPRKVEGPDAWSGRLALQVEGQQAQSFSAGFELHGNARSGELTLTNPLGGTAAVLNWAPGTATMRSGSQVRQFESLDALAAEATGTAIPIAALFDWLRGQPTQVPGWQVDLSQLADGKLRARREQPPPAADLRVALER